MELRERPYSQFNFLVSIGDDTDPAGVEAGFQEVSGLGLNVRYTRYRNGNERRNAPRLVHHGYTVSDVTLKRGVIGASNLAEWLKLVQDGKPQEALRTVTIKLLSEDQSIVATTWTLRNARPVAYRGPLLHGESGDVAIEALTVAAEDLVIG